MENIIDCESKYKVSINYTTTAWSTTLVYTTEHWCICVQNVGMARVLTITEGM